MSLAIEWLHDSHWSLKLAFLLIAALVLVRVYRTLTAATKPWPGFPLIELEGLDAAASWKYHASETISRGREITDNGFFQIMTGNGPKIVVPNRFLEEIKADKDLDVRKGLDAQKAFSNDHFWTYSGMIGFKAMRLYGGPIRRVVQGKISAAMLAMTKELASEAMLAVDESMPLEDSESADDPKWHSVAPQPVCEEIVARLSTLIFLGQDACRNRKWLEVVTSYAFYAFRASAKLRACSPLWRPLAHRFWFPESKVVRRQCAEANALIKPMVEKRRGLVAGGDYRFLKVGDTLGWLMDASQRNGQHIDCVGAQMLLMLGAVGDTTETMTVAIVDLCRHRQIVQALREEIIRVFTEEGGWNRNVFAKLRLMDSFLKESQRMHPLSIVPSRRIVVRKTALSDNTILPKGAIVTFAGQNMDPSVYPRPEVFEVRRFLAALDEPNHKSHYTGMSTEMINFGYGAWACPGRFFAVTMLKIALMFFVMENDFRLDDLSQDAIRHSAGSNMTNAAATIQVRQRKEKEVDLRAMLSRTRV